LGRIGPYFRQGTSSRLIRYREVYVGRIIMCLAQIGRSAVSAIAVTLLLGGSALAQPLAMTESMAEPANFPASIFDPMFAEPVAPQQPQYESAPADDSAAAMPDRLRRQVVAYGTREAPGTIVVDTPNTYLYYVLGNGRAIRYGIGVGREGFTWSGVQTINRKQEWPDWHPPAEMIARQPYLPRFMAGGPGNPLGARAMYLGGTLYRIHGTSEPTTIGKHVSSGCIRLLNADVIDLYNRVQTGTKVVVLNGSRHHARAAKASRRAPRKAAARHAPARQAANPAIDTPRPVVNLPQYTQSSLYTGASASLLY
jgi:lipoprotein-anchoring transpeptidase ErfK/SrfK